MLSPLDLMGPIGLITVLGLAPSASAYWYDDDEHREAKIAAWVVGMLAGTALITFAVWYSMRRRRAVLVGYASYRPPPPPGVVGYDTPYGANPPPPNTYSNGYGGYGPSAPAPPPPAYQAHTFPPPPAGESSSGKFDDGGKH